MASTDGGSRRNREAVDKQFLSRFTRVKLSSAACDGSLRSGTLWFCVFNIAVGVYAIVFQYLMITYYGRNVGFLPAANQKKLRAKIGWQDYMHCLPLWYGLFCVLTNVLGLVGALKRLPKLLKAYFVCSLLNLLGCINVAVLVYLWSKVHFNPFMDACEHPVMLKERPCNLQNWARHYQFQKVKEGRMLIPMDPMKIIKFYQLEGWVWAYTNAVGLLLVVQFFASLWFLPATLGLWRVLEVGGTGDEYKSADEIEDEERGQYRLQDDDDCEADELSPLLGGADADADEVDPDDHCLNSFIVQMAVSTLVWINIAVVMVGFMGPRLEDWKDFKRYLPEEKLASLFNLCCSVVLLAYMLARMLQMGIAKWFERGLSWLETLSALVNFVTGVALWYYASTYPDEKLNFVQCVLLFTVIGFKPELLLLFRRLFRTQASMLRMVISENRRRLVEDGFDLDLTYITPRIIAMAFPSEGAESSMRNPIEDVQRFLFTRHGRNHKVWNLCAEENRRYRPDAFAAVVQEIQWPDHNPCPLKQLQELVESQHEYLAEQPSNVVVIHCKGGKGRTGLTTACLLLREQLARTPQEALALFAEKRTTNGKGVTNPSQIRNVELYDIMLREGAVRDKVLRFTSITLHKMRGCSALGADAVVQVCYASGELILEASIEEAEAEDMVCVLQPPAHPQIGRGTLWPRSAKFKEISREAKDAHSGRATRAPGLPVEGVSGDIKVSVLHTTGSFVAAEEVFLSFWLHTGYVHPRHELHLEDLDDVKKNKHAFPKGFKVSCVFETPHSPEPPAPR